ncbi:MAG: COQ9 family protein [Magnetospirillum sp.]|nr:COQ9 family protein [Magnetospirillum sp.]
MNTDDRRDDLVLAAVPHAAFDGWAKAALMEAARDLGLDEGAPSRLFPGGPIEAVAHFADYADRIMARDLAALPNQTMRTGERVFQAVKLRLEPWTGSREAVRRALALLALPRNLGLAARLTWRTADAVWVACGDISTDFSRFSRRATLAPVYAATVLYWLDDPSEGCAATWDFLHRRLTEVQRLPKVLPTPLLGRGIFRSAPRPVRPAVARSGRGPRADGD